MQLADLFTGPGKTVRRPDEIVASVTLPLPVGRTGAAFDRLTRRRGVDLATINVCCLVGAGGTTRFAYSAVGPRPVLVEENGGRLADPSTSEAERETVLRHPIEKTSPISDVRAERDYRLAMLLVLSKRTLEVSLNRLRSGAGLE